MGYYADTVDKDFTIPADKVRDALVAVRTVLGGAEESLSDVVEDLTCFQECTEDPVDGFVLGFHCDKFLSYTEDVLEVLAQFANEGSYVRFSGEDGTLFGYRVVNGRLRTESGDYVWRLDPEQPRTENEGVA